MAQRRIKIVPDGNRDLISLLPVEVKDRILGCLPTRDAAKTALLSTHWKNAWLQHERLNFGLNFFWDDLQRKRYNVVPYVKIITCILLQRVGPVKKFSLTINSLRRLDPKLEQSDLDQWFLFLSRNGIEELSIFPGCSLYKLPFCIVSCPTIKQLRLSGLCFDFPINATCIFPGVTSLAFLSVDFNHNVNGIVYCIPNLEKLDLTSCGGINNFKIISPKLENLSITGNTRAVESRWFALHLKAIKVLCMEGRLLLNWEDVEVASFPTAINLQVIKLRSLEFANEKQLKGVLQLLQKSPNLCELDIKATRSNDGIEAPSRLLKDPDRCIINQDLKMFKTFKIKQFCGSTIEMLFVKMLLSKSPVLDGVVITESFYMKHANRMIKILKELLCFPRASPSAQIAIKGEDYA